MLVMRDNTYAIWLLFMGTPKIASTEMSRWYLSFILWICSFGTPCTVFLNLQIPFSS